MVKSSWQDNRHPRVSAPWLTKSNLAPNGWKTLLELLLNHLSHIVGRSCDHIRPNMELSNRMMGRIAQWGHGMGYLTPLSESVMAIHRGASQAPETAPAPPPAPEEKEQH